MSKLILIPHGDYIKPEYRPAPGQTASWAGESTPEQRKDGAVSGIVTRFKERKCASPNGLAFGWIKERYADAITYASRPQGLRGLALITGLLGAALGAWFALFTATDMVQWGIRNAFDVVLWLFPPLLAIWALCFLLWTIRLELFRPEDEPIVFDRKHRKVYRIFRETQPGVRGLFKRWPLRAAEYDWDLIDVEHNAQVATTGSTITRYHSLIFIVRRSADDPTIIDSFNIGNSLILGEATVPAVWEHIRRFMEEGGPHLPPGEQLAQTDAPKNFWQALCAVAPLGENYLPGWRDQLPFMLLIHVLFPFFVPFYLIWGFFNWLSYATAIPVTWPPEVSAAVGQPGHRD